MAADPIAVAEFFIPGRPKTKDRPRAAVGKSGRAFMYSTKKTAQEEAVIREFGDKFARENGWEDLHRGPIILSAIFVLPKAGNFFEGKQPSYQKCGDLDNLLKTLKDGMNGTVYKDDSQIVGYRTVAKKFGDHPGVYVKLEFYAEPEAPKKRKS